VRTFAKVGRPYELDPRTLGTIGEDDMGGQIGQRLAGHYRVVREQDGSRRCVCFGTQVIWCVCVYLCMYV
jgi:carotenoid cleavage dioxygenase-like enzyme